MLCTGMGFGRSPRSSPYSPSHAASKTQVLLHDSAIALLSPTFAILADRYGRSFVIIPAVILMAVALALLPLAHGFPWFVISASLYGIGFGSAWPATMALLIDRIQSEKRGLAISTYFTGFDAGITIGAILLGVASQYWGFGVMWPISAVCTLLGLTGLLTRRRRGRSIDK